MIGRAAGLGLAAAFGAYAVAGRRRMLDWGASRSERGAALPGDDLVARPRLLDATRAIDIAAAPGAVWPWLVQMGAGRAGWYSYDLIDNGGRPSARRIVPELQALAVGDVLPTGVGAGFRVVALSPERHLVLSATGRRHALSWALVLAARPGGARLVMRIRADRRGAPPAAALARSVIEPADFMMMRRQLLGIRARAEGR